MHFLFMHDILFKKKSFKEKTDGTFIPIWPETDKTRSFPVVYTFQNEKFSVISQTYINRVSYNLLAPIVYPKMVYKIRSM